MISDLIDEAIRLTGAVKVPTESRQIQLWKVPDTPGSFNTFDLVRFAINREGLNK